MRMQIYPIIFNYSLWWCERVQKLRNCHMWIMKSLLNELSNLIYVHFYLLFSSRYFCLSSIFMIENVHQFELYLRVYVFFVCWQSCVPAEFMILDATKSIGKKPAGSRSASNSECWTQNTKPNNWDRWKIPSQIFIWSSRLSVLLFISIISVPTINLKMGSADFLYGCCCSSSSSVTLLLQQNMFDILFFVLSKKREKKILQIAWKSVNSVCLRNAMLHR